MPVTIYTGEAIEVLATLPDGLAHCCVTSPPYWGLRDYGVEGQLGLEKTPEEYVVAVTAVFLEVYRVLSNRGVLWLNLGDRKLLGSWLLLPAKVALSLAALGWTIAEEYIWERTNPPIAGCLRHAVRSHEYVYLLTKAPTGYRFDRDVWRRPHAPKSHTVSTAPVKQGPNDSAGNFNRTIKERRLDPRGALGTTVWRVSSRSIPEAHFATFPPKLIEPCIKAGCPEGGTVLDPFGGAGTTGLVADRLGRDAILIEINPEYAEMARQRIRGDAPLFAEVVKAESP
jgi:site-specific DNA-methyltransferase (adenine-specific)